jgi:ubiquinone/menaquinone biosynthesis C-methylase UbiE
MSLRQRILMRAFGRPQGAFGRLGGAIMARMNEPFGNWVLDLLAVQPTDHVLEVGFGPGAIVQNLSRRAPEGHVAGVDPSPVMVEQARARCASAIQSGHVDLRLGSAESLPFADNRFDKALAINSMQVWQEPAAGLREIQRILKPGGLVALGFTSYFGQARDGVLEQLSGIGFTAPEMKETGNGFCALARKP